MSPPPLPHRDFRIEKISIKTFPGIIYSSKTEYFLITRRNTSAALFNTQGHLIMTGRRRYIMLDKLIGHSLQQGQLPLNQ